MEKVKILGIDPSLRNTGLAIVTYNTTLQSNNPEAFSVTGCQVVSNPQKFTGKDAIMNMIDMLQTAADCDVYQWVEAVVIESPAIMFNKAWSAGTISSISHIAGATIPLFGLEHAHIFRPNEWNKTRKKEVTHQATKAFLGDPDGWGYERRVRSEKLMEHVLDAASIALWWIRSNYLED